ncbi:hypothetical protein RUND412_001532 [Rhizina undulata]
MVRVIKSGEKDWGNQGQAATMSGPWFLRTRAARERSSNLGIRASATGCDPRGKNHFESSNLRSSVRQGKLKPRYLINKLINVDSGIGRGSGNNKGKSSKSRAQQEQTVARQKSLHVTTEALVG